MYISLYLYDIVTYEPGLCLLAKEQHLHDTSKGPAGTHALVDQTRESERGAQPATILTRKCRVRCRSPPHADRNALTA